MKEQSLIKYVKASFPYITMHTFEPQRAIDTFAEEFIATSDETLLKFDTLLMEWRPSMGFTMLNEEIQDEDDEGETPSHPLIASIQNDENIFYFKKFIHVMGNYKDAHDDDDEAETLLKFVLFVHLESFGSIDEFLNTEYTEEPVKSLVIDEMLSEKPNVTSMGTVVFIHPFDDFPRTMEHEMAKLSFDLPSQEQRLAKIREEKQILREEHGKDIPDLEEDTITAENLAGLTDFEAENLLYLSLMKNESTYKFRPRIVQRYRTSLVNEVPGLTILESDEKMSDVGGHNAIKDWFKLISRAEIANDTKLAPRGAMVIGPPGVGKSMIAKALGNLAGIPTLQLRIGELMDKYVGGSQQNVKRAFEVTRAIGKQVLFIDEIDKAFTGGEQNETSKQVFSAFLTELQDAPLGTFFMATANDMKALSRNAPELVRTGRWDKKWFFDFPSTQDIRDIFAIYIGYYSIKESQYETMPNTPEWTGAEIKQCCKEAAQMDCTLEEASKFIIPISVTGREKIDETKEWATGNCISSTTGRLYDPADNTDLGLPNASPRKKPKKGRSV